MTSNEILTIALSAMALIVSVVTFISTKCHDVKKDTIEAFNTVQKEALDKLYYYSKSQIVEIAKNRRSNEYKEITLCLSRIEHYCVGINNDVYNRKIVYSLAGEYLVPLYDNVKPIIESKRKVPKAENVYSNFEKVVRDLERIKKNNGNL